jgi:hypothetical protein
MSTWCFSGWRKPVALGLLALLTACGGGGGGGGSSGSGPAPANGAPQPVILLAGGVTPNGVDADVSGLLESSISFNASGSTDPEGDLITYKWSVVSKPDGSKLTLSGDTASQLTFKPDAVGLYVFNLRVTDAKGAFAEKRASVMIREQQAPLPVVVINVEGPGQPVLHPTRSVTLGTTIVLDAGASSDADGTVVSTGFDIIELPAGSRASLIREARAARFSADALGTFKVRVRNTDNRGATSEAIFPFVVDNRPPTTVVLANVNPQVADSGQASVTAAVGYLVSLSGLDSSDAEGDALTYAWSLSARPAGSNAALNSLSGATSQLTPDLRGDYVVKLTVTDTKGGASTYTTTVKVDNTRPLAHIGSNAVPVALPSGPSIRLPVNTVVTLRGSGSTDADGDTLTYAWSLPGKPEGSKTTVSAASSATVQLVPDSGGTYTVLLRVTDTKGAFSEQLLTIEIGNYPPVAVIDKERLTVLAGSAATASGALSFDEDNDALTYTWAIDAQPAGVNASIAAPNSANLSFTPPAAGTYVLSLTASDGKNSSVAYVSVKALASVASSVALDFVPLATRYSKGLDRAVLVAANPNALKIVDPFTGVIRTVLLPAAVKSLQLSPNGKLAAVLHEGVLSLVDLEAGVLLRSSSTGGAHTDAFVTDAGMAYLIGQTGGQWVDQAVTVINARTGADLSSTLGSTGSLYGTQYGVFAGRKNKIVLMEQGLSPADLHYITLDPATGKVTAIGDSPYHGDYSMTAPLYLSSQQDIVFTSAGTFFYTDTLRYAGRLTYTGSMQSLSHSGDAQETLLMTSAGDWWNDKRTYQSAYKRYAGALFLPDTDVTLPEIGGAQSYGIQIFHSANGNHVALVQTGAPEMNASGIKFYLTVR